MAFLLQIVLLLQMLKFSKNHFLKKKCFVKENEKSLGIFPKKIKKFKWKSVVRGPFHMKVGDGLTTFALWVPIYGPNMQGDLQPI